MFVARVLNRKISAGAAHAGHHLVGDQQNAMAPANFGDFLQISGRRDNSPQGRAADRFENKRCRFAVGRLNRVFQFSRVFLSAVPAAIGAVVVAAIAIRNAHVREFTHHGQINFPPPFVARH